MIYTPLIQNAVAFAIQTHEIHQKQKRKGKDIPYITHPLAVGLILARAGASERVIAAGILHDTIEDSVSHKKVSREMLADLFGQEVANIVADVSEPSKNLPWEARKAEALARIKILPHDALLVKSADIISNSSELLADYAQEGEGVFIRFNAPKERLLRHYTQTIKALLEKWPENPLANDLEGIAAALQ